MLKLSDIREKEVINIYNGQRLGYVSDFEIDLDKGIVTGIILPGENKVMSFFSKTNDIFVDWKKIIKIGSDIILVNLKDE
ncbi:YlmC/YmxH family sporulation protein [Tissierella sp. Yu-01]|uniref:YlmC/YmxH family sporulation protein n=1 Tax=Tissierella sp. Yu-01 TaxID=3035694 RepID=UPI00240E6B29|nr:YlmC/YmxH family sporulation protein [Tissierella sp. Yu-01]WFA09642.1 YlmC/YmxH family sporulation protein [Tissierella sp. Yu-01]